jgi:hypothetical protein
MADEKDDLTQAPALDDNGHELDGEHSLPINHRLRAEALAKKGRKSDPGELISDELIAETRERLDAEKKAEEELAKAEKAKAEKAAARTSPNEETA